MAVEHLYVHVPFCARKCPYCDFNSHAGRDAEQGAFVDALLAEARRHAEGLRPRTVFVGGGTPTHLEEPLLDRLLGGLREVLDLGALEEWTVEANPGTVDASKAGILLRHGVDRVSVGVQSFDDRRLKTLGRIHTAREAERAFETLRAEGVPRLSLDLMLATPGQTLSEQRRDIACAVALQPEHVSAYVLTFEEGTAYHVALAAGRLPAPVAERDLEHLHAASDDLAAVGYSRYEVSNHARPGAESRHNLGYWRGAEWLGLGPGAHSHVAGRRWKNEDDPAAYAAAIRGRGEALVFEETPTPAQGVLEDLMMGLRLVREGVDLDVVTARHGLDPRATHADALALHVAAGFLELDGPRLRCTPAGIDVLGRILLDFVPDEDLAPAPVGPGDRGAPRRQTPRSTLVVVADSSSSGGSSASGGAGVPFREARRETGETEARPTSAGRSARGAGSVPVESASAEQAGRSEGIAGRSRALSERDSLDAILAAAPAGLDGARALPQERSTGRDPAKSGGEPR